TEGVHHGPAPEFLLSALHARRTVSRPQRGGPIDRVAGGSPAPRGRKRSHHAHRRRRDHCPRHREGWSRGRDHRLAAAAVGACAVPRAHREQRQGGLDDRIQPRTGPASTVTEDPRHGGEASRDDEELQTFTRRRPRSLKEAMAWPTLTLLPVLTAG